MQWGAEAARARAVAVHGQAAVADLGDDVRDAWPPRVVGSSPRDRPRPGSPPSLPPTPPLLRAPRRRLINFEGTIKAVSNIEHVIYTYIYICIDRARKGEIERARDR